MAISIDMKEILKLSVDDRISMIEKIWESIEGEDLKMKDSHKKELERRLARYNLGTGRFYTWNDIKKDLDS